MDAIVKPLGAEGNLQIELVEGKVKLTVAHNHASGSVAIVLSEDVGYFLDKLAEKIPGDWDKAAFEVLKGILKAL